MLAQIKRLFSRYGFHRQPPACLANPDWADDSFFTAHKAKTERLAAIARERDALKEKLAKAVRDKKARQPIYKALRALSVDELRLESGK
jgi:hypothetical protein